VDYVCPDHGDEGILDVRYDYDLIGKRISPKLLRHVNDYSIWRYKPLLPVFPTAKEPPLAVGWTPLYHARRLGKELGMKSLWVKDDGRQPTASFKDRASAVAVVKAQEKKAKVITTASTGNAAAALSGLCASVAQANVIFVPESAPEAKIAQLLAYGSKVLLVKGTYDDAFELCLAASKAYGWYNRNTGYNPYMSEGKKTAAFEICEQLKWQPPDRIFVSVGDGCIIGGLHKGLKDMLSLGWIKKMPKLMGVQATGSSYLYTAWKNNEDVMTKPPVRAESIADSICAGLPRDRIKALAAVKQTGGAFICVSDKEILEAVSTLARRVGVFAEPAAAAGLAGLEKALSQKKVDEKERIVVISTGSGLKDVAAAMASVKQLGIYAYKIEPNLGALKKIIDGSSSD
jgi:threonine synthase